MISRLSRALPAGLFAGAVAILALSGGVASRAADEGILAQAAAQSAAAGGPDRAAGEKHYAERCAACHDTPTGRTPAKATLATSSPDAIVNALKNGPMAPMAEGLTQKDMEAIAFYLTGKAPAVAAAPPPGGRGGRPPRVFGAPTWASTVAGTPLDAPMCKDRPAPVDLDAPQWNGWGRTVTNARYQPEPGLTAADLPRLKVKWAFQYPGWKQGQATVIGQRLFVTSMSGAVYSLNAKTGCVYWRHEAGSATRSSVSIGRLPGKGKPRYAVYLSDYSASAIALDAETGKQLWKTKVDDQAGIQMTGSPTLYEGKLFVPVSSGIEAFATNPAWECCKFRGKLIALDAVTGKILWHRYTTDVEPHQYVNADGKTLWGPSGGAIWSAPTVDAKRKRLYIATSNSYTDVPHDGSDSLIALDIETGSVLWRRQFTPDDDYLMGCYPWNRPRGANCPSTTGGDYALGNSPILHTGADGKDLILVGQKSSEVYAVDPDTEGKVVWQHRLSVGSELGGVEFGMAADGDTLYVPIADSLVRDWGRPGMTGIRISDGAILWNTPSPRLPCRWTNSYCSGAISQAATAIPGAVLAGSMNARFRAYDKATGKVIWEFDTAGQQYDALNGKKADGGVIDGPGPTVAGGMVYVNSGYAGRSGPDGAVLLAFSVDGK